MENVFNDPPGKPVTPISENIAGPVSEPGLVKGLLDPVDRVSEVLYGLIMTLTFTGTISVANANSGEVRSIMVSAIGCNISWGFVDAVMFILSDLIVYGRERRIMQFMHQAGTVRKSHEYIAEALPPVVTSVLTDDDLEVIRIRLMGLPDEKLRFRIGWKEIQSAIRIFLLVTISTFPVVLPFMLIAEPRLALRISNLVAIFLMFLCGWFLGRFGGYSKILMALAMTLLGSMLVGLTIFLGG